MDQNLTHNAVDDSVHNSTWLTGSKYPHLFMCHLALCSASYLQPLVSQVLPIYSCYIEIKIRYMMVGREKLCHVITMPITIAELKRASMLTLHKRKWVPGKTRIQQWRNFETNNISGSSAALLSTGPDGCYFPVAPQLFFTLLYAPSQSQLEVL